MMNNFLHNFNVVPNEELEEIRIDGKRHYIIPGYGPAPSVTTILSSLSSPGLEAWKNLVGKEEADFISRITASRGKNLHAAVERYLKNEVDPTKLSMPDTKILFNAIKPSLDRNISEVFAIEKCVYSTKLKYAGRLDIAGVWNEKPSIIDIKTHMSDLIFSGDKIEKYFIQCSAYAIAFQSLSGIEINQGVLVFVSDEFGASVHMAPLDKFKRKWIDIVNNYYKGFES